MTKKGQQVTQYILHRGFRGTPGASLAGRVLIGGLGSDHEIPYVAYTQR